MKNIKQQKKDCPVCGMSFHNRKKWQARGLWEAVVYCSEKCRKRSKVID